jgi:Tfp pilus assembly protein PilF
MIDSFRRLPFFLLVATLGLHAQTPAGNAAGAPDLTSTPIATVPAPAAPGPSDLSADNIPNDPAAPMLRQAYQLLVKKDFDGALTIIDEAVKNNPKSFAALTLRGMIYSQKKEWTSADADFNTALAIDPNNIVVKFNLGEIKFVQKDYDTARARFAALANDPVMGDFASYKVFLCDLFGNHEDQAKKELDVFNAAESHPSYYFGNAAWDLYHKNIEDARGWLNSAANIYIPSKNQFYAASLKDLGYLPLPPPPNPSE